jgi:hydrogenase maturation protease
MESTVIIGYGNPDRQDDGAAWHVLSRLAVKLGREIPANYNEGLTPTGEFPDLLFVLQLTPELADTVAQYQRVCFIDVHTGSIPLDLQRIPVQPAMQTSPFTHHMTPATLLALTLHLYNKSPDAILISIRGYKFGFDNSLSHNTGALVDKAVTQVLQWLQEM